VILQWWISFLITALVAGGGGVITNPRHNIVEKNYVHLEKVGEIRADLGNNVFLFLPCSLAMDNDNCLYVYDQLQASIIKFDTDMKVIKTFGREGQGPGELSGIGKNFPVFIKMGRDGKLYANDVNARKIIVFDHQGKYLRDFRYNTRLFWKPTVDDRGNTYFFSLKGNLLHCVNEKSKDIFKIDVRKGDFDSLFYPLSPLFEAKEERETDISANGTVLIYLQTSSTLYTLRDKKAVRRFNIWPKEALQCYKKSLGETIRNHPNSYEVFFAPLFVDEDNADIFYLQFGQNKTRGSNALYSFTLRGELVKILYVDLKESRSYVRFELKKNNRFYAIAGERIAIYKEEK
jgi:hypothetical protein